MKKSFGLIILAAACAGLCAVAFTQQKQTPAPAAPAAKTTPAPAKTAPAANAPATTPAAAAAAPAEALEKSEGAGKKADELLSKVAAAYAGANSYTIKLDMRQMSPRGSSKQTDKLPDEFDLMYLRPDAVKEDWMMRLQAREGYHKRTVVVYAKDDKGKYKFTVYKPAGRVIAGENDPRVADVPSAEVHKFVEELADAAKEKGAKLEVQYFQETGQYALMVTTSYARTTTYIDGKSFMLVKQILELKTRNNYRFKREIRWHDFKPGAKLTPEQITARPGKL
jgi:hypothetical protein